MSITYPITLPSTPGFKSIAQVGVNVSGSAQSPWTLSEQVQQADGAAWAFNLALPAMGDVNARIWFAALSSLKGRFGTILFGHPLWKTPRGTWAGSPLVAGAGQLGESLVLDGFTAAATVKAGDVFQLEPAGALSRLHMALTDGVADGSGNLTLDIWPRLRTAPADNGTLTTTNPKGIFRLASPNVASSWEPFRHGINFDVVEALTS